MHAEAEKLGASRAEACMEAADVQDQERLIAERREAVIAAARLLAVAHKLGDEPGRINAQGRVCVTVTQLEAAEAAGP